MSFSMLIIMVLLITAAAYFLGTRRAEKVAGPGGSGIKLHSRPIYYGWFTAVWCGLPALIIVVAWQLLDDRLLTQLVVADLPAAMKNLPADRFALLLNEIHNLVNGLAPGKQTAPELVRAASHYLELRTIVGGGVAVLIAVAAMAAAFLALRRISPDFRARNHVEKVLKVFLIICSSFAVFTTVGIVLSVLFEAIRFFKIVPITDFLFGLEWRPQIAIRPDQVGARGVFGAVPIFAGTLMISGIAMLVAVPLGLMSAIYLSEYADRRLRLVVKPLLEILAGIPTVVYGFFAALTVAPFIRDSGGLLGLDVSSESALAAGLVMGVMIIPFVSSLSDDVLTAVPDAMRDGSLALGATKSETIKRVVIPAALPGIVAGVLLAVSRAIGETMIVVMAAGLAANLTANPLEAVTTVTVQIVTLLVGDQEFDSPKTLAAFALGLVLFLVTLVLNIIALQVVRKYREQYE